jgi:uncharacterized protein YjbI with pentapeptide repeats
MSTVGQALSGVYQVMKESLLNPFTPSYLVRTSKGYVALRPHADLRGADLRNMDLTGIDLSGADLREADLSGAVLKDTVLEGALTEGAEGLDAEAKV